MIIDTSVVIAAVERRDPRAVQAIEQMEQPSTRSMVVLGELTFGVEAATVGTVAIRSRSRDLYLAISDPSTISSLDGAVVAHWFGVISALAQAHHIRIGQNDRWIVAETLAHSTTLLTADAAMRDLVDAVRQHHDVAAPTFVGS